MKLMSDGAEFLVNSQAKGNQTMPKISGLTGGGFVVAWLTDDPAQDGRATAVKAQIFDGAGGKQDGEFLVNDRWYDDSDGFHKQDNMEIAALGTGGFVVTYSSDDPRYDDVVQVRLFDADGFDVGGLAVNPGAEGPLKQPGVATLADGGFAIAWQTTAQRSDKINSTLWTQAFDSSGHAKSVKVAVDFDAYVFEGQPSLTGLASGGYAVTWFRGQSVMLAVLDAKGTTVENGAFLSGGSTASAPSITTLASGQFVASWATNNSRVEAQLFAMDGSKIGSKISVSTDNNQASPSVVGLSNGGFLISWTVANAQADGNGYGVKAQLFGADGLKVGNAFLVNSDTLGNQHQSDVAVLNDGSIVIGWRSDDAGQDGNGSAIKAQIYTMVPDGEIITGTDGDDIISPAETPTGQALPTAQDDRLYGMDGKDYLSGGAGPDEMHGGAGDDKYIVDDAGDVTIELKNEGTDSVLAYVEHWLNPNVERLLLRGDGDIAGHGNSGDNEIYGNEGRNRIEGGAGKDVLRGGGGGDQLRGGSGADKFVFDKAFAEMGVDTIEDFRHGQQDKITLDLTLFEGLEKGPLAAEAFHFGDDTLDATDRIVVRSDSSVWWDADGVGAIAAIQFAIVWSDVPLSASDFHVIP